MSDAAETLLKKFVKAFPDKRSVAQHNRSYDEEKALKNKEDKSQDDELESLIDCMCLTNNSYNKLT